MDALRQTAAVSGQAIALLKQSYERIGELEQDRRIHADETVAALLEGAQKKDANADDELAVFTRAVAPKLAEKMVEKHGEKLLNLLGGLIGDDA
jgi:predicted metal-dependent hydrolase